MKNIVILFWLFVLGLGCQNLLAQNSASAVMEIRVEVIEGRQAESSINNISFNNSAKTGHSGQLFGTVNLNISEDIDCLVSVIPQITIRNSAGEMANLDSELQMNRPDSGVMTFEMYGKLAQSNLPSPGVYTGSQVVEIEYF